MRNISRMIVALGCMAALCASAAEVHVPKQVTAGNAVTVSTNGSGEGTLIVAGPGSVWKGKVALGSEAIVNGSQTKFAGRYVVALEAKDGNASAEFFVVAANPASIAFQAQPSRVPVARPQVISGTAFVMDQYNNLVTSPTPVKFELAVPETAPLARTVTSKDGVAWVRMDSGKRDGAAQLIASAGNISTKRVVQQVASEPCNLRIHAQPYKNGIVAETDPVRDCSGNAVPDGTIVTFTQTDASGKSTVDARVKRGIARAELPAARAATISVASGVVAGNELRWGGGR
jgi:hypothetical protein